LEIQKLNEFAKTFVKTYKIEIALKTNKPIPIKTLFMQKEITIKNREAVSVFAKNIYN